MKVLLIGGKAGAGKDTVANFIQHNFPNVKRLALADPIKSIAFSMGWDGDKDEKGRRLLQHLGQVGREYNENMWVADAVWRINLNQLSTDNNLFVISDFRFPNEYSVLKETFSDVVTLNIVGRQREMEDSLWKDVSENSLSDFKFDYTLVNSGTLSDLEETVIKFVEENGLCTSSK